MVTLSSLYTNVKYMLARGGIENRLEAQQLIRLVTGFDRSCIATQPETEISEELARRIAALVEKRISGCPLQYILGSWEFFGYEFSVGEGVLIPRADTEILVEAALELLNGCESPSVVDLCSGSGCIAVTLDKQLSGADITAVELMPEAARYLTENIRRHSSSVKYLCGDVLDSRTAARFSMLDCIVSNPPYLTADDMSELQPEVAREPESALFGGSDGLDFYRAMTPIWTDTLKQGGSLLYEIGCGQHDDVADILDRSGLRDITMKKDLAGIIRVVSGKRP